ncbi:MAG: RNB domain-containing ribonuclease, partial [Parachlamydiaceae bacterium]
QLVEEFMLKANELVALHLANLGKNLTYRIHDMPSEDNMRDFALMAEAFGFKMPLKPTPQDVQRLFEEAEGSPIGPYLATHYIRRMKMAQYSPQNIGHFGLSLSHYCHFTSPIRRYVDLVAHRLLFGFSDDISHLEMISSQASEKERISAKAEMSVLTLKKLRYANAKKKADPNKQYEAVITKIRPFGFSFEVLELMLDSSISLSDLEDYYVYDDRRQVLRGERRKKMYALGDKILVHLKGVDLIHLEAFWDIVE